ncbi:hypothetical protein BOTBODRAFT_184314 [Botryobasidium botryosum FD-172 SS1]|uniref:Uncharacterized protein n=1 Tax=Botryobasidium botryosum (strain FD-172 SS1) TaxID=930990 RepID=A0A067MX15_BOTB1|nr:hypothetical protein BOTBODRAFT_184314 [Botryobasidium botryosum FD-172 SS1]
MEIHPQSPDAGIPKNAALTAWLASLDNLARTIQLYTADASALRQKCDPDRLAGRGPASDGAGAVHADVFSEIDKRIGKMQDMEAQLFECRAAMQAFRNRSTTLVPINRLPSECISQILTMACGPEPVHKEDSNSRHPRRPGKPFCLALSSVCRRWRNIALDTPRAWASIQLSDAPPFKYSELMLERSRGRPLHIRIHFPRLQGLGEITNVLHLLQRYISNRYLSLTVIIASRGEAEFLLAHLDEHMERPPQLIGLALAILDDKTREFPAMLGLETYRVTMPMDRLRSLHLISTRLLYCIIPAYANLMELRLNHVAAYGSHREFEAILSSCQRLEFLQLSCVHLGFSEDDDSRNPVVMSAIRTIELVKVPAESINRLLQIIVAPALEALRIQGEECPPPKPEVGESLAVFLATSSQYLQDLSLGAVQMPPDDVAPVLELLSHISSLRLSHIDGITRFLETLASGRCCLQLESLTIENITCGPKSSISASLRKLVQPDNRPLLQRLVVRACEGFDPSDIAWLRANAPDFTFVGSDGNDSLN